MNKNKKNFILLSVLLCISVVQSQYTQTAEDRSNSAVQDKKVKKYDIPISTQESFLNTLRAEKKPGGIVVINRNCLAVEARPQIEREYASLDAALNSIVRQDPWYEWSLEQEVVNLIPANDEPDFLKIKIKKFRLDGDLNTDLALERLLRLPEVKDKAEEINLNKGLMSIGLISLRNTKPRLKFELKNTTVRQVLNEIVRKDGIAVWRYYESNCNGKTKSYLEYLIH